MSDRLHIILTGDEGKARNLLFSKRKLKFTFFFIISLFLSLSFLSYKSYHFFYSNRVLDSQVAELARELNEIYQLKEALVDQVQNLQKENSAQAATFQQAKATLLNTAVSELEERSEMIERIMANIGIEANDIPAGNNNSGGPFISPKNTIGKELLYRSDRYMETINSLPLGRPIPGLITSGYGHRKDPVNGRNGFHSGVDMRGAYGQKILATADGIVTKAFRNGSYGKYVEINHGNGYSTKFAHMKKILVKRGDRVKRGQAIGIVGSSGRSTGPHLHYEVCFNGKPLNPSKFIRVDKLTRPIVTLRLSPEKNREKIRHRLLAANKTTPVNAAAEK